MSAATLAIPRNAIMLSAAVRELDAGHNLVGLVALRRRMVRWDRQTFDAAVSDARRCGLLTATALEGRDGVSPEERGAAIREDGALLGFLGVRR